MLRGVTHKWIIQLHGAEGSYLLLWHLRERLAPGLDSRTKPREYPPSFGSGASASLVRGFVFLLLKSLPTPVRLGADAALSLIRHAGLESVREFIRALSRSSRGAEMKTEMSPRALVFSSGRPERNAVSIATCRHSVMTGERVCARACTPVYGHNSDGGVVCCCLLLLWWCGGRWQV